MQEIFYIRIDLGFALSISSRIGALWKATFFVVSFLGVLLSHAEQQRSICLAGIHVGYHLGRFSLKYTPLHTYM